MALQIKHKIVPNNSNRNIVLSDITGAFSSTNPGGYGSTQSPTGLREATDSFSSQFFVLEANGTISYTGSGSPTIVGLVYAYAVDVNGGYDYYDTETWALANGATRTYDLGTLVGNTYIDGVYKTQYGVNFQNAPVTSSCTGNTTLTVSDTTPFTGATKIRFVAGGITYEYDIVSVNSGSITLSANGPVLTSASRTFSIYYTSTAYFANTYSINKCLHSRISKLAISSCTCNNGCTEKLYEAVMLYMAIQPNMDLGKYQKAQDIIEYLTNYCNDGCCNC